MVLRGEIILSEEPFAFVLKSTLRNEKCEFCFSPAELKCSKCQYWRYCNKRCQKLAWAVHKLECDKLKNIFPKTVPDSAHMLIRILLKLKFVGIENCANKYSDTQRPFKDLMSHTKEIKNDKRRMEHFTSVAVVVHSFFGKMKELDEVNLLELFGKVCINSFNIMDQDMNNVGTGIYLNASILDHSCNPNAVVIFNGTTICVRSIKDIPDFRLDKVRISYIDTLSLSSDRKKELESMYYFICNCDQCINKTYDDLMVSMKCTINDCSGTISVAENKNVHVCSECGKKVSDEYLQEYQDVIKLSDYHLQMMISSNVAYIDICEMMLAKQEKILTDFNIRRVKMLDFAVEACINLQRWEAAVNYGFQLLPAFRKYYEFYHPLVGLLNTKLLKLVLLLNYSQKYVALREEAEKILLVTHGRSHPLFETLKEIMYN